MQFNTGSVVLAVKKQSKQRLHAEHTLTHLYHW